MDCSLAQWHLQPIFGPLLWTRELGSHPKFMNSHQYFFIRYSLLLSKDSLFSLERSELPILVLLGLDYGAMGE